MTDPLPQLGLFDDPREREDRARREREAARARELAAEMEWRSSPRSCPVCGREEATGWLVVNNHGVDQHGSMSGYPPGQHPIYGAQCLAQNLIENQLRRAVNRRQDLTQVSARAREVGLDVDTIIADALDDWCDAMGVRIPSGHTVMMIRNYQPNPGDPHLVRVDQGDKTPAQCADDFAHSRRHEIGQSHTRDDADVFTIRHDGYPGPYQRIWWETAP